MRVSEEEQILGRDVGILIPTVKIKKLDKFIISIARNGGINLD